MVDKYQWIIYPKNIGEIIDLGPCPHGKHIKFKEVLTLAHGGMNDETDIGWSHCSLNPTESHPLIWPLCKEKKEWFYYHKLQTILQFFLS